MVIIIALIVLRRLSMNNVTEITFIYDTAADMCFVRQEKNVRELTVKGTTENNGAINGTWFQVDKLTNHWISFKPDKYRLNTWEAFYKCVSNGEIKYYRRLLPVENINALLVFSFTEKDEWIKNEISGKWRNKF